MCDRTIFVTKYEKKCSMMQQYVGEMHRWLCVAFLGGRDGCDSHNDATRLFRCLSQCPVIVRPLVGTHLLPLL